MQIYLKNQFMSSNYKKNYYECLKISYLCRNMGRIVALDYGKKRTGVAVSDPLQIIAGGLTTLPSRETVRFLQQYISDNKVDMFILGDPRRMNNEPSENRERVLKFKEDLHRSFPDIEIRMVDERFTTCMAHQAIIQAGLKKKDRQNKALVDEISATILLQSFLESKKA